MLRMGLGETEMTLIYVKTTIHFLQCIHIMLVLQTTTTMSEFMHMHMLSWPTSTVIVYVVTKQGEWLWLVPSLSIVY